MCLFQSLSFSLSLSLFLSLTNNALSMPLIKLYSFSLWAIYLLYSFVSPSILLFCFSAKFHLPFILFILFLFILLFLLFLLSLLFFSPGSPPFFSLVFSSLLCPHLHFLFFFPFFVTSFLFLYSVPPDLPSSSSSSSFTSFSFSSLFSFYCIPLFSLPLKLSSLSFHPFLSVLLFSSFLFLSFPSITPCTFIPFTSLHSFIPFFPIPLTPSILHPTLPSLKLACICILDDRFPVIRKTILNVIVIFLFGKIISCSIVAAGDVCCCIGGEVVGRERKCRKRN